MLLYFTSIYRLRINVLTSRCNCIYIKNIGISYLNVRRTETVHLHHHYLYYLNIKQFISIPLN